MSAPGRFIAWCKQEQASLQQQLALMNQRKVLTGENRGTGWVDTTSESIERIKARLAELDSLLTETGAATVSKPEREKTATDSTIKKVEAGSSPRGDMGQKYLVAGKKVSMRLWTHEPGGKLRSPTKRDCRCAQERVFLPRSSRSRSPCTRPFGCLALLQGHLHLAYGYGGVAR
jgi:hypothetical protein